MILKRRKNGSGFLYMFWCPACREPHTFDVQKGQWEFDGDWEKPSFSPSLNLLPEGGRCHLFLKKGIIEFLPDCRHHLRGQNVPIVEFPE